MVVKRMLDGAVDGFPADQKIYMLDVTVCNLRKIWRPASIVCSRSTHGSFSLNNFHYN